MDVSQNQYYPTKWSLTLEKRAKRYQKPNPVRWRPISTLVNVFRQEVLQERSSWCPTGTGAALEVPSELSSRLLGRLTGLLSFNPPRVPWFSFPLFSGRLEVWGHGYKSKKNKTKTPNNSVPRRLSQLTVRDSRGTGGARLGKRELKLTVSVVEAATTKVQVTQLLFKSDTVIWRAGGGTRSFVLSLKGPPEFQSPPCSVSRTMRSQKNLEDVVVTGSSISRQPMTKRQLYIYSLIIRICN